MMDPQAIELALGSAALGGLAGKFTEYTLDAGKSFLSGYFRDHGEAITKTGEDNFTNYLTELIKTVRKLESDQQLFEERFNETLGQPSFAVLLQKSVIGSAKTGSREKHKILAKLISERLLHEEESEMSLSAEEICETILKLNTSHLIIIGLRKKISECINENKYFNVAKKDELIIEMDNLSNSLDPFLSHQIFRKLDSKDINNKLYYLASIGCMNERKTRDIGALNKLLNAKPGNAFSTSYLKNLREVQSIIETRKETETLVKLREKFYNDDTGGGFDYHSLTWIGENIARYIELENISTTENSFFAPVN